MKIPQKTRWVQGVALALTILTASFAHAQGVLAVTPGRTVATTAGTAPTVGYTGDNAAATSATLARPSAVAYDGSGNLFIADTNNHVIREVVKSSGNIITVAGTGIAGFSGDGATATAAQLDTPTGIAVDTNGNLYIADSHNNRIRKVSSGSITTIAGTGAAGFGGDAAAATTALLNKPSGIAVDASGNIYIADTNNNRIRKITGTTISTIAGTGEQGYAGDSGAATAALLDSPTSVAVDASGNVFIADRHNQRVREITGTTITTIVGSGTPSFAGSYSGDGASATAASLAKPTGVSVDANGNIYIADSNNQRVRQVAGGTINTVAGDGTQGTTSLSSPRGVANDASGNLAIADTLNQRTQGSVYPTLTFSSTVIGLSSAPQTVTLSNTGTASITVANITFTGPFTSISGGTCSQTPPIMLTTGASCTLNLVFVPTVVGAASGSVSFGGSGVVTQAILLAGTATQGTTTTALVSSAPAPFINNAVTFTATVSTVGTASALSGSVSFYINYVNSSSVPFATVPLNSGSASAQYTFTTATSYNVTAIYSGNTNYTGSTAALTQVVADFSFTLSTAPGSVSLQSVKPGDTAVYTFTVAPLDGPFSFPIVLSATGLPPGATVTFTPNPITLGANPATFTMSIKTAPLTAMIQRVNGVTGATFALLFLFVPISRRRRRAGRTLPPALILTLLISSIAALGTLSGCGTGSGFFGQAQQQYNITVTGSATGSSGQVIQHTTTVQLIIQ